VARFVPFACTRNIFCIKIIRLGLLARALEPPIFLHGTFCADYLQRQCSIDYHAGRVHYAKINMTIPLASRGRLGKGGTIIESSGAGHAACLAERHKSLQSQ
jgi:hypothetical protein